MTQSELARRTGASKTTINSIITRNNECVNFILMRRIADVLEVPIEYFFDREPNAQAQKSEPAGSDGITESEKLYLSALRSLAPENRHVLLVIAEALLRDQGAISDHQE